MFEHQQVLDELEKLVTSRKVNPTNSPMHGTCVYTEPKYRHRHCVVGQITKNLGGILPAPSSLDNVAGVGGCPTIDNQYTERAKALLTRVQAIADCNVPWGKAVKQGVQRDMQDTFLGAPMWAR